jgi:hypothetical protein
MALSQKEADIQMLLAAGCHLGTKNCSFQVRWVFLHARGCVHVRLGGSGSIACCAAQRGRLRGGGDGRRERVAARAAAART